MNWKKLMPITLGITLLIPVIAFADTDTSVSQKEPNLGQRIALFADKFENTQDFKGFAKGRLQGKSFELTEEMKVKMEEIRAKIESGELTPEEAREEMGLRKFKVNKEMTEEMKAKMEEIRAKIESGELTPEEAREEMGLRKFKVKKEMTEEMKAKMEEIRAKIESGELTPEEAREEMMGVRQEKRQNMIEKQDA